MLLHRPGPSAFAAGWNAPGPRCGRLVGRIARLLRLLRQAAQSAQPAPSNILLELKLRFVRQSTARAVRLLKRDGHFSIDVFPEGRRFRFGDGTATGWGEFREGHIPGPRGQVRKQPPRAPNSLPKPPNVAPWPYDVGRTPSTCQFPMREDGERPRERAQERFCGQAAIPGERWRMAHLITISPQPAQTRANRCIPRPAAMVCGSKMANRT